MYSLLVKMLTAYIVVIILGYYVYAKFIDPFYYKNLEKKDKKLYKHLAIMAGLYLVAIGINIGLRYMNNTHGPWGMTWVIGMFFTSYSLIFLALAGPLIYGGSYLMANTMEKRELKRDSSLFFKSYYMYSLVYLPMIVGIIPFFLSFKNLFKSIREKNTHIVYTHG